MTPHTDFRIPDFSFIQNLANSGHIIEKKQECWKNIFQDPMSLTIQSRDPVKKWKKTINRIIKNWKRWIVRFFLNFSSVQFSCSLISNSLRPHGLQHARLLLELTQTHVHWVGDAIQPSHPRSSLSSCLQSFPASGSFPMSQFFPSSGESIGASVSSSPSNEYSELISFRIDWRDLRAVQGTLKSLLQYHSSKSSILCCAALFMVQLSQHTQLLEKP